MNDNENEWTYLRERGITGRDIENMEIETDEQMVVLKTQLRLQFPLLMANIVKVMLFKEEEKLACLLTSYYEMSLDEDSFYQAVDNKSFTWLSFVWAFGKNYIGSRLIADSTKLNIKQLMDIVCSLHSNDRKLEDYCRTITKW